MPTITVDLSVPDGYELTGEFRSPVAGEYYLSDIGGEAGVFTARGSSRFSRSFFILRQSWTPPVCFPDGFWLYVAENRGWEISSIKPSQFMAGEYGYGCDGANKYLDAYQFASFHGETFTPPTSSEPIQITRS